MLHAPTPNRVTAHNQPPFMCPRCMSNLCFFEIEPEPLNGTHRLILKGDRHARCTDPARLGTLIEIRAHTGCAMLLPKPRQEHAERVAVVQRWDGRTV